MRLPRGKKKKMITTQAEFKKSLDTISIGYVLPVTGFFTGFFAVRLDAKQRPSLLRHCTPGKLFKTIKPLD
jgi:hypothetical protein